LFHYKTGELEQLGQLEAYQVDVMQWEAIDGYFTLPVNIVGGAQSIIETASVLGTRQIIKKYKMNEEGLRNLKTITQEDSLSSYFDIALNVQHFAYNDLANVTYSDTQNYSAPIAQARLSYNETKNY
jgi:hypothetical protein